MSAKRHQDEEIVKMVARMTELKEKQEGLTASRLHGSQEPGSTKKEKDAKKEP